MIGNRYLKNLEREPHEDSLQCLKIEIQWLWHKFLNNSETHGNESDKVLTS